MAKILSSISNLKILFAAPVLKQFQMTIPAVCHQTCPWHKFWTPSLRTAGSWGLPVLHTNSWPEWHGITSSQLVLNKYLLKFAICAPSMPCSMHLYAMLTSTEFQHLAQKKTCGTVLCCQNNVNICETLLSKWYWKKASPKSSNPNGLRPTLATKAVTVRHCRIPSRSWGDMSPKFGSII